MRNLLLLFSFLLSSLMVMAQLGRPVASFGNNGKMFTMFPDNFTPTSRSSIGKTVIPLQDGKTLIAIESSEGILLTRHLANGQRDIDYGFAGFSEQASFERLNGATMQPNGYVLVFGLTVDFSTSAKRAAVVRIRPDGFLDRTFGNNGLFLLEYSSLTSENELLLLADNKIMLVGTAVVNGIENFYLARLTANGLIDATFGNGGMVTYENSLFKFQLRDAAVQADGRIIVGGNATAPAPDPLFQLARFLPDGTPDRSFGGEGTVVTKISDSHNMKAIALQPDGKIVVLGGLYSDGREMLLARYLSDGSLDHSFSNDGKQIVVNTLSTGRRYLPEDIIVLPDGKIMVGGAFAEHATIWRLNANGELDPSFYGTGFLQYDQMHTRVLAMAVYPSGKIAFTGLIELHDASGFPADSYLFARLDADGAADFSLANASYLFSNYHKGGRGEYLAVSTLPDGKILAAGTTWSRRNGAPSIIVSRYYPDGTLDFSFGSGGMVNTGFEPTAELKLMQVYPDGRILLYSEGRGSTFIRLNPAGYYDPSFNGDGTVETIPETKDQMIIMQDGTVAMVGTTYNLPKNQILLQKLIDINGNLLGQPGTVINTEENITVMGAVVLASGKILIGGKAWHSGGAYDFSVTRLNSDGSIDKTFGNGGTQIFDFGGNDEPQFMKLMPKGGAFIAGKAANGNVSSPDFAMVQFNNDGSLNKAFGTNGKKRYDLDFSFAGNRPDYHQVTSVDVQANGKILISGTFRLNGKIQFGVGRFNEAGILDPTFANGGYYIENIGIPFEILASAITSNRLYLVGFAGTFVPEHSLLAAYHIDDQPLQATRQAPAPAGIEGTVQVLNNPAATEFTLNLDLNKPGGIQLRILDASGGVIERRQNIAAQGAQRFGANYRPGTYMAEITQGAQKTTIKLIKL